MSTAARRGEAVEVDLAVALDHGLSDEEYQRIKQHLGRVPSIEEIGVFSVMWSEHCSYKSSRVHLKRLPQQGAAVLQGPGENAGAVDIGGGMAAIFKIESHNHPSYIEPYQGAATGVGGILRDVFTMGARPVASMNSLRFGGAGHEKTAQLLRGVVAGIGGYGNSVGVATIGGELYFDEAYNGNILVNAFNLGVVKADRIFRAVASGCGNPVLYIGSKTGRDGIHGASLLASSEFKEESEQMKPTVQVGDPFTENLLIEACLEILAGDDVVAIQDMGAAGLTSSSVEMASRGEVGIKLDLDKVPLRDETLLPYEMLLSESQERMLLVAHKGRERGIEEACERWGLDCVTVGEVTGSGRFEAVYRGETVVSIPVDALTDAAPLYRRPIARSGPVHEEIDVRALPPSEDLDSDLRMLLSSPNLSSRRWVFSQYDSFVGADTVAHPGCDAGVIRVRETGGALAMTCDCNSRYVKLDPYVGTQHAMAEAVRNIAVKGGKPLAVSDCLNFGNPEKPEVMWQFSQAIDGMAEACEIFDCPVISGNVSFYNDTRGESIPPTPVVAMVGLVRDCEKVISGALAAKGWGLYLLGGGVAEFNASEYLALRFGLCGARPPALDLRAELRTSTLCRELIEKGMLRAAHDVADGGLAVALAEMCMAGGCGCEVSLDYRDRADLALFGESGCRIIVAVDEAGAAELGAAAEAAGVALARLGASGGSRLRIASKDGAVLIDAGLSELRDCWEATIPAIAEGRWPCE